MASNGEMPSPSEGQTGSSMQSGGPTVESICCDFRSLVSSKDAKIERLQSQLQEARAEIDEGNQKRMEIRQEMQSLKTELKNLQAKYKADGLTTRNKGADEDIATDATVPHQVMALAEENASLKLQLKMISTGQITVPSESLASDAVEVSKPDATTVNARPETAVPSSTGPPLSLTQQATASSNNSKMNPQSAKDSSSTKVIEGAVTLDMIDWLSENVSHNDLKPLVRKLGVKDIDIADVENAYRSNIKEQRYQTFKYWQHTHSSQATVVALLKAMQSKSLHQLTRDFCSHFELDGEELLGNKTRKKVTLAEDPAETISGLEKFMHPFLRSGDFPSFVESLHKCSKLSAAQRSQLGCASQEGDGSVDVVLQEWASEYYKSGKSIDQIERSLAMWDALKICGKEVRDVFKTYVDQGGVIGPVKDEESSISKLPFSVGNEVEALLSMQQNGVADWRHLLEWLKQQHPKVFEKVDRLVIKQWEGEPTKAPNKVLSVWATTTQDKVGTFYKWTVKNGRLDIAKALE